MTETLGNVALVFWSPPEEDHSGPAVEYVRRILEAVGLNPERALDVPPPSAFRRAVDGVRKEWEGLCKGKLLVRFFNRSKDKALCVQLDTENENGDGRLHREHRATFTLGVSPETGGLAPLHVDGGEIFSVRHHWAHALEHYTWADVTKILQSIFKQDALGAHSPRKNGAIYFVPFTERRFLEKVEQFYSQLGGRFLIYNVPDTQAQREEISQSIFATFSAEMFDHNAAIESYDDQTREGIIDNRRSGLAQTELQAGRLANLLGGRAEGLRQRIAESRVRLDAVAQRISEARASTPVVRGSRRVQFARVEGVEVVADTTREGGDQ